MALLSSKLKQAEYTRVVFSVSLDQGQSYEDCLEGDFWVHVANKVHVGDRIEVTGAGGEWFAELYVGSVGKGWLKVASMRYVELAQKPEAMAEYKISWGGPKAKHRVIRVSDLTVMQDGFNTAEEAKQWVDDLSKKLAA